MEIGLLAPLVGVVGLVFSLLIYMYVAKQSVGTDKMRDIGNEIHLGAMTFLKAQYSKLAIFVVIVAGLIVFSLGQQTAIAFVFGALCSGLAGFIGMKSATKGNVRTAAAAKDKGVAGALLVAFNSGAVTVSYTHLTLPTICSV